MPELISKNILIISREQALIDALASIITGVNFQYEVSHDVPSIANSLMQSSYDLILLDMNITDVGGFPVLEEIRTKFEKKHLLTPVIIASEGGDLVEIGNALKFGIKDYFIKSTFSPMQIQQKIIKHTGGTISEASITKTFVPISNIVDTEKKESPAVYDMSKIKVLIVEDDKFLRDLAVQKLTREGIAVVTAVDGEQGVMMAEKELPNIILLDILLPGIDGFEVLRRIRANDLLARTTIAMLSNFGQREDIEKAIAAGADQFFIKANYTLDEIVEEIKKISAHPRVASLP